MVRESLPTNRKGTTYQKDAVKKRTGYVKKSDKDLPQWLIEWREKKKNYPIDKK